MTVICPPLSGFSSISHLISVGGALVLIAYILGSIPYGLILTKFFKGSDLRTIGSGNIGATNVLRTGSKALAAITLILDVIKGAVAIGCLYFLAYKTNFFASPDEMAICHDRRFDSAFTTELLLIGLFSILGHCFPVWLKFKGGKGVATTFGVLFAAVPWAGFLAAVTWGIVAGFTRYSSLAALSAIALTPLFTFIYYGAAPAIITVLIGLLVFWRHKENIQRLMAGTESKIGSKKKDQDEPTADTE